MRELGLFLILLAVLWGMAGEAVAMERPLERKIDAAFAGGQLAGLHGVLILHRGNLPAARCYAAEPVRP